MKKILPVVCFLLILKDGIAQSVKSYSTGVTIINQLCPDFVFDTLINYKKEKLALSELKGKFVIIDFWGTFCLPCIRDIPKLEQLQRKFGDTLQILMVATDGFQKAKQFYDTRQKANKPMLLPCAINKKAVNYFQVKEVSTYAWIDDRGYVRALTDNSQLTAQNVADFVHNNKLSLRGKEKSVPIDHERYLATVAAEMDSSSVLFSSSLTKYLKGGRSVYAYPRKGLRTKLYAVNTTISYLYRIAFGDLQGAVPFNRTIIESEHSEKYQRPTDADYETWKVDNTFCYELDVPEARQKDMLTMMQGDLKKAFGLHVYKENRTQKCLVLKVEKPVDFMADTTVTPKLTIGAGGITIKNRPFSYLPDLIQRFIPKTIVLDETGKQGHIDVVIQAEMNDANAVNAALKKYGLSLRFEDRSVEMLIIKDPQ